QGQSFSTCWQWNATVGKLIDRPGRVGDWGYINTHSLGLLEYMYLCEDMEMEPIMAVWAGYSLNRASLPENELAPYIQQAIDQINFVIRNPATSEPAALCASLGHPEPFPLQYVEIGNEDFFASESYIYCWRDFVGNLMATFPQLKFITTWYPFDPILIPIPKQYDNHVYQTPGWFTENAFYYDSFQRNGTYYFEGEYAVISTNASDIFGTPANRRLVYPDTQGSSAEAAFMTGLERNSDIVFAALYAPLLM
ncbi:glycoside hydrolase superfamily, partial [Suillus lakei]